MKLFEAFSRLLEAFRGFSLRGEIFSSHNILLIEGGIHSL